MTDDAVCGGHRSGARAAHDGAGGRRRPGGPGRGRGTPPARRRLRGHRAAGHGVAPAATGKDHQRADHGAAAPVGGRGPVAGRRTAAGRLVPAGHLLRLPVRAADHRLYRRLRADLRARRAVRRAGPAGAAAGRGGGTARARPPLRRGPAARSHRAGPAPGRRRGDRDRPRRRGRGLPHPGPLPARLRRGQRRGPGADRRPLRRPVGPAAELQRGIPRTRPGLPAGSRGAVLGGRRGGLGPDRPAGPGRDLVGHHARASRRRTAARTRAS